MVLSFGLTSRFGVGRTSDPVAQDRVPLPQMLIYHEMSTFVTVEPRRETTCAKSWCRPLDP